MRIILRECKKILNVRLLLILGLFTVFFYNLYIQMFYVSEEGTQFEYTMELYLDLVEQFGPVISMEQYDKELQDIKLQLSNERDELIKENKVFQKVGIQTYDELQDYYDKYLQKSVDEMTEEEKQCDEAMNDFNFFNKESSRLVFQIQEIERMDEFRNEGMHFGQTKEAVEKMISESWESGESEQYQNRRVELGSRQEMSLLPDRVIECVAMDMPCLAILIIISCLVVVIPYQIRERMNRVLPIYISTKTGRKLFSVQMIAVLCSGTIICLVQFTIYTILCYLCKIFVFWNCPTSSLSGQLWVDMSFGEYYLLYFLLIWIVGVTISLVAYWISRVSSNYIIGIAIAIPIGVCISIYTNRSLAYIYSLEIIHNNWIHWTVCILFLLVAIGSIIFVRKDKKRELL